MINHPNRGRVRGADIVHSPDDGGFYARMFERNAKGEIYDAFDDADENDSPIFDSKPEAEAWARQHGATVLLYP
jgi:hypothetical protein